MPIITWTDDFSVKSAAMDAQHKKLVSMINDLHDAMSAGKGKEVLGPTLDGLVAYAQTHFVAEENLMAKGNYPDLAAHKKEHEAFVKKALELQTEFKSSSAVLTFTVMEFLKDWLLNHIQKNDKKYAPYV